MTINLETDRFAVRITEKTIPVIMKNYGVDEESLRMIMLVSQSTECMMIDDNSEIRLMAPAAFNKEFVRLTEDLSDDTWQTAVVRKL